MSALCLPCLADRFWSKVDRRKVNDCWPWKGVKDGGGRGQIAVFGRPVKAPRVAFLLEYGHWPKGFACHRCDDPGCVNPKHLFEGSAADNVRDMMAKGRHANQQLTHCKHGHPLDEENTYWRPGGGRDCRKCRAARGARQATRIKARISAGRPAFLSSRPDRWLSHCKNGHPYDGANTHVAHGRRICRRCSAEKSQRYRDRRTEAAA